MTDTIELKPCPYCPDGGSPHTINIGRQDQIQLEVHCGGCGIDVDGVEAWNARSTTYALGEAVEALRGMGNVLEFDRVLKLLCSGGSMEYVTTHALVQAAPAEIMAAIAAVTT